MGPMGPDGPMGPSRAAGAWPAAGGRRPAERRRPGQLPRKGVGERERMRNTNIHCSTFLKHGLRAMSRVSHHPFAGRPDGCGRASFHVRVLGVSERERMRNAHIHFSTFLKPGLRAMSCVSHHPFLPLFDSSIHIFETRCAGHVVCFSALNKQME